MLLCENMADSLTTNIPCHHSTHCNTAQIWSCCTQYSSSVVHRYPVIYVIPCVGEKNGKRKIVSICSTIILCFVINVLNNETILYPSQSCGISLDFSQLFLRPHQLIIRRYSARFRRRIILTVCFI